MGFADEMRVGLRGMVRRVWGRRGVRVVQRVQLAYRWMYLFLFVDGRQGRLSWTWRDSMRSEAIASAVRSLRLQTELGALAWDGARGHRAEEVERVGLQTIVQPPDSPELNPAERVFEEVRRWPGHRGQDGGCQRVPSGAGIGSRSCTLARRLGLNRLQHPVPACTLSGRLSVNWY